MANALEVNESHQKLNGELREEVKSLKNDMKLKHKEIGRMMGKINKLESRLK